MLYLKILHTILDIAIFKYTVYCKLFSKSLIITDVDHFFLSMHALLCMYIPYFLVIHLLVDIWVNNDALKMGVQISPGDPALSSLGHIPRS